MMFGVSPLRSVYPIWYAHQEIMSTYIPPGVPVLVPRSQSLPVERTVSVALANAQAKRIRRRGRNLHCLGSWGNRRV